MVYGTMPGLVYPFLTVYLNMEGTQTTSASVLILSPWSFKVIYGILSDCFPIFGYRRRPWITIFWSISFTMCMIMLVMDPGPPYFPTPEVRDMMPADYPAGFEATFNESSRDGGQVHYHDDACVGRLRWCGCVVGWCGM